VDNLWQTDYFDFVRFNRIKYLKTHLFVPIKILYPHAVMAKQRKRQKLKLHYKRGELQPDVYLNFVQMDFYEHGFKKLKLTDMEQQDIEVAIMVNPEGPPRVEGTGGLRKIRIAFDRLHKGKSNGFRVG
jgi:hypothetical protein